MMKEVRVYILWVKAGMYSREASNHGAGMSVLMEGGGDTNKEHRD